ncbi:MAG TPA: MoxR family ATPase [Thermoanaerobaculia bacterium]|nr:MoxR family ATPase [Thermoanaerobaculia bacterium]
MATYEFRQYRGNGTKSNGEEAETPGEHGCYLASEELADCVNTSLAVGKPLLVTGKAGTGKTSLAYSIAAELELGGVEVFAVRSDHLGRDLLFEIDNLQRFYDAQIGNPKARDRRNYLRLGALGKIIVADERKVLLIDEIDKAPRDFPNDLLHALDKMELRIPELGIEVRASHSPIVVITSNEESRLPDAFLRRCVFHHIEFPDKPMLESILKQRLHHLGLDDALRAILVDRFLGLWKVPGLLKQPSTSELLTWALTLVKAGIDPATLPAENGKLPYLGTLLKTGDDLQRVKRGL